MPLPDSPPRYLSPFSFFVVPKYTPLLLRQLPPPSCRDYTPNRCRHSTMEFIPAPAVHRVLCADCGTPIVPNSANLCVACLRNTIDITEGIPKQGMYPLSYVRIVTSSTTPSLRTLPSPMSSFPVYYCAERGGTLDGGHCYWMAITQWRVFYVCDSCRLSIFTRRAFPREGLCSRAIQRAHPAVLFSHQRFHTILCDFHERDQMC